MAIYFYCYQFQTSALHAIWKPWWRHQMETFSALLILCAGNSPVTGEFPIQRPVMRGFDVSFDLRWNKRLSKQPWGWWFDTPSCSLWRHSNAETPIHAIIWHLVVTIQAGNTKSTSLYQFYITAVIRALNEPNRVYRVSLHWPNKANFIHDVIIKWKHFLR